MQKLQSSAHTNSFDKINFVCKFFQSKIYVYEIEIWSTQSSASCQIKTINSLYELRALIIVLTLILLLDGANTKIANESRDELLNIKF